MLPCGNQHEVLLGSMALLSPFGLNPFRATPLAYPIFGETVNPCNEPKCHPRAGVGFGNPINIPAQIVEHTYEIP